MKKIFLTISVLTLLVKCKPAAEDREMMHIKAKRVSDSIAKTIDDAMAEVAITNVATPVVSDTTKK